MSRMEEYYDRDKNVKNSQFWIWENPIDGTKGKM